MKVLPLSKDKEKKYRKIQKALDKEFELHELDRISNSTDEEDEINNEFEIHPLSYYLDTREELVQHMFVTIKGAKLKRMVPPALRHLTTEELKADCLIQILGLSKKRILHTIDGKALNSSSDDSDSDSSVSSLDIEKEAKALKLLQEKAAGKKGKAVDGKGGKKRKSTTTVDLADSSSDTESKLKSKKKRKKKAKGGEDDADSADEGKEDGREGDEEDEDGKKKLIELIELEMRARAIRKLLGEDDSEVNIKEEPNSDDDVQEVKMNADPVKTKSETSGTSKAGSEQVSDKSIAQNSLPAANSTDPTAADKDKKPTSQAKPEPAAGFKKRIRLNRSHLRTSDATAVTPAPSVQNKTPITSTKPKATEAASPKSAAEKPQNKIVNKKPKPDKPEEAMKEKEDPKKDIAEKKTKSTHDSKKDTTEADIANKSKDLTKDKVKVVPKEKKPATNVKKDESVKGKTIDKQDPEPNEKHATKVIEEIPKEEEKEITTENTKKGTIIDKSEEADVGENPNQSSKEVDDKGSDKPNESQHLKENDHDVVKKVAEDGQQEDVIGNAESSEDGELTDQEEGELKEVDDKMEELKENTEKDDGKENENKEVNDKADDEEILVVEEGKASKKPLAVIHLVESTDEEEVPVTKPRRASDEAEEMEDRRRRKKEEVDEKKRKHKKKQRREKRKQEDTVLEDIRQLEQESVDPLLGDQDMDESKDAENEKETGAIEEQEGVKEKETEGESISWQKRWLESKDVQKVVTASKLCTNIRKRMRFAHMMKKQPPAADTSTQSTTPAPESATQSTTPASDAQTQPTAAASPYATPSHQEYSAGVPTGSETTLVSPSSSYSAKETLYADASWSQTANTSESSEAPARRTSERRTPRKKSSETGVSPASKRSRASTRSTRLMNTSQLFCPPVISGGPTVTAPASLAQIVRSERGRESLEEERASTLSHPSLSTAASGVNGEEDLEPGEIED